ncbi:MAG: tetratricopeptide repeat protein [Proteobacteria bacterium]|nr:tetratricopeptide repeat protein [Pseudomonadota bacterium]
MNDQPIQRRLAAILAADIAGYTRLMNEDEDATIAAWQSARTEVIKPSIVATLPGRVEADSHNRARQKPTDNMAAYECVLAGKVLHHHSRRQDNAEALKLLDRAIELDPGYAHARAWRACVLGQAWVYGWDEDPELTLQEIAEELERALALDENDADVHRILAALNITRHNFDQALLHQEMALNLNPNYDLSVVQNGELMTWLGRPDEGIEWIKKAMQLNPFHPPRFWSHLGRAYFVAHRYQDAIEAFKHINTPDQTQHAFIAASYAYLDDDTQAAAHGREVLNCAPDFTVDAHMVTQHYLKDDDHTHHRDGLLKAGLPA